MAEKALRTLTPAQFAFLKWLHETHPELAKAAEERRASVAGFMDALTSTFQTITEKAPELAKEYLQSREQIAQLDLNIARAKAGQAPLTSPLTFQSARQASGIPVWVWGAGGALVAYLLFKR